MCEPVTIGLIVGGATMAGQAAASSSASKQQNRYLDGVAAGAILTAALNEPGEALPERPATRLSGGRLNGTKIAVPYAGQATWMLVSTDSGIARIHLVLSRSSV